MQQIKNAKSELASAICMYHDGLMVDDIPELMTTIESAFNSLDGAEEANEQAVKIFRRVVAKCEGKAEDGRRMRSKETYDQCKVWLHDHTRDGK